MPNGDGHTVISTERPLILEMSETGRATTPPHRLMPNQLHAQEHYVDSTEPVGSRWSTKLSCERTKDLCIEMGLQKQPEAKKRLCIHAAKSVLFSGGEKRTRFPVYTRNHFLAFVARCAHFGILSARILLPRRSLCADLGAKKPSFFEKRT